MCIHFQSVSRIPLAPLQLFGACRKQYLRQWQFLSTTPTCRWFTTSCKWTCCNFCNRSPWGGCNHRRCWCFFKIRMLLLMKCAAMLHQTGQRCQSGPLITENWPLVLSPARNYSRSFRWHKDSFNMLSLNMRNDFKPPCVAGTQIKKAHNLGRKRKKIWLLKFAFTVQVLLGQWECTFSGETSFKALSVLRAVVLKPRCCSKALKKWTGGIVPRAFRKLWKFLFRY